MINDWERRNRELKTLKLIEAIDDEIGERVTGARAKAVADQLGAWPSEAWRQIARKTGVRAPSATTVASVVLAYQRRAQRKAG